MMIVIDGDDRRWAFPNRTEKEMNRIESEATTHPRTDKHKRKKRRTVSKKSKRKGVRTSSTSYFHSELEKGREQPP